MNAKKILKWTAIAILPGSFIAMGVYHLYKSYKKKKEVITLDSILKKDDIKK